MITFFTTAKPFLGHSNVIQRNALRSWTLVHPDAEVILFGDDEGAASVCQELGLHHESHTEKSTLGATRMDYMFRRAQAIAKHGVLCYSNCDIIFMEDFREALERIMVAHKEFLFIGRRWDADVTESCDFESPKWRERMRKVALTANKQRPADWIDYFAFSRGLFADLPPLVVGRVFWDNWTVWKALDLSKPVVDASRCVLAVHQNHDYRHHPQGKQGVWHDDDANANYKFAGGWKHLRRIDDATELMTAEGLRPNWGRHWRSAMRYGRQIGVYYIWQPVWHYMLRLTRPLRAALGLRSRTAHRSGEKV